MKPATQIFSRDFDVSFFKLPIDLQERIQARIDRLGMSLHNFSHRRLTGMDQYRLRIGDYRVIYDFNIPAGQLYLLDVAHRREVYR